MINVLFFARLKDEVGQADMQIDDGYAGNTIAQLQQHLIEQGLTSLQDSSIRVALNQKFSETDVVLHSGDEVAFMPPVTGG